MMRCVLLLMGSALSEGLRMAAAPMGTRALISVSPLSRVAPIAMQFGGKKKSAADILEEKGYWPGEWVCADCGYIYEPGTTPPFEELRAKWKCPQCAGPRRRFVKKAGVQYGAIDESPLFIGMGISVAFIAFALYVGLTI